MVASTKTYVLVHGAWHSGQAWSRVVPLLGRAGHRVFTPTLTGYGETAHLLSAEVGLDTHVQDVVRLILDADLTDVVLVGHSYAGMVVTSVVNEVPDRIAEVVYLDAMVPQDGEAAVDALPVTQSLIDLAAASDTPWRIPAFPETAEGLFGVRDPADLAWLRTMVSDQSVNCLQQPARLDNPAAAAVPRTHIHCVDPVAGPVGRRPVPAVQPNGNPSRVWQLASGHDCMITVPGALADLLLRVA